jgi:hypothetical protein
MPPFLGSITNFLENDGTLEAAHRITNGIAQLMQLSYCGIRTPIETFTTKNQLDFQNRQRELWNTAFMGG